METLQIPYYIALGNHDNSAEGRSLMTSQYGGSYYTFKKDSNQFIFLNTENNEYEPSIDQIVFLESTSAKNIFLFTHKLMWVNHTPLKEVQFDNHGKEYFKNIFWKKLFPVLVNTNKDVYCIAGDVAGEEKTIPASYEKTGNVRLISSGIGNAENENVLVISTEKNFVDIKAILLKNGKFIEVTDFLIEKSD
tara:strand:- start:206 stop:781 length:576 start_codon:yes stop_codon:yes gene_type:complete